MCQPLDENSNAPCFSTLLLSEYCIYLVLPYAKDVFLYILDVVMRPLRSWELRIFWIHGDGTHWCGETFACGHTSAGTRPLKTGSGQEPRCCAGSPSQCSTYWPGCHRAAWSGRAADATTLLQGRNLMSFCIHYLSFDVIMYLGNHERKKRKKK